MADQPWPFRPWPVTVTGHGLFGHGGSAEREGVGGDARREAQLEQAVADSRAGQERVEPVAADGDVPDGPAVDANVDPAAPAEDEVDVPRLEAQAQAGADPGDDPLRADAPDAGVRQLVLAEPAREAVRRLLAADDRRAGVAGQPFVAEVRLRRERPDRRLVRDRRRGWEPPPGVAQ